MAKPKPKKKINLKEKKYTLVKSRVADQKAVYNANNSSKHSTLPLNSLIEKDTSDLFNITEAAEWASEYLGKNVTPSNISYLIQYGRVRKIGVNGNTQISKNELLEYYKSFNGRREILMERSAR